MLTLFTSEWIPVASRSRTAKDPTWIELPDAPPLSEVQRQRDRGQVLTALKYDASMVTVVMRPAAGVEA